MKRLPPGELCFRSKITSTVLRHRGVVVEVEPHRQYRFLVYKNSNKIGGQLSFRIDCVLGHVYLQRNSSHESYIGTMQELLVRPWAGNAGRKFTFEN